MCIRDSSMATYGKTRTMPGAWRRQWPEQALPSCEGGGSSRTPPTHTSTPRGSLKTRHISANTLLGRCGAMDKTTCPLGGWRFESNPTWQDGTLSGSLQLRYSFARRVIQGGISTYLCVGQLPRSCNHRPRSSVKSTELGPFSP